MSDKPRDDSGPADEQAEAHAEKRTTEQAEVDEAGAGEDIRAKMREALDRKHHREREGEAHLQGHEKAHGVHGKSGGPREFRRKAGP